MNERRWRELYEAALSERDLAKLEHRVRETEEAIVLRVQTMANLPDFWGERKDIENASVASAACKLKSCIFLTGIRIVRTSSLFPPYSTLGIETALSNRYGSVLDGTKAYVVPPYLGALQLLGCHLRIGDWEAAHAEIHPHR